MTNTATEGSVAQEQAAQESAGNPNEATATRMTNGSGSVGGDWWSGLQDEGNQSLVETKGWKEKPLDEVLKSYKALESRIGQALVPPGEGAGQDEWNAFYEKLGRPEKPEGYQFKVPESVPAEMPYDAESAEKFKAWSHKAGLTPSQAQILHDEYLADTAGRMGAMQQQMGEAIETAHRTIEKEWGEAGSEMYQRNLELADRAARKLGLVDALKRRGAIAPDGSVVDADFAFALSKIGGELYAEDKLHGGPTAQRNPFSDKHFNLTEQGKLVRGDPEMAKAFIRSAGLDVKTYFPNG